MAPLFIIIKNCKLQECLSEGEWITISGTSIYGILLTDNKEQTTNISNLDDLPENYAERKKKDNLKRLYTPG